MRKAPESTEIDNPLLAQRIQPKKPEQVYKLPQDIQAEKTEQLSSL